MLKDCEKNFLQHSSLVLAPFFLHSSPHPGGLGNEERRRNGARTGAAVLLNRTKIMPNKLCVMHRLSYRKNYLSCLSVGTFPLH